MANTAHSGETFDKFTTFYKAKHGVNLSADLPERVKQYSAAYESKHKLQLSEQELWRLPLADEDLFGDVELIDFILKKGIPRFALNEIDKWVWKTDSSITMALWVIIGKSYVIAGAPWGRSFPKW